MAHVITLENGYTISDQRARIDMEFVHASLAQTYGADPQWVTLQRDV